MVGDNISYRLCVGSGSRTAAPDGIVHLCQFVGDSVRNIGSCGGTAIGTENNSVFEVDGHTVGGSVRLDGGMHSWSWSSFRTHIEVPRLDKEFSTWMTEKHWDYTLGNFNLLNLSTLQMLHINVDAI